MKAMKTVVLNGSPKGMTSVTMQYVRFLQKKFPQHAFTIFNVCQDVKKLEGDQTVWREVIEAVEAGDVVLWATPVYVFLVPGPYKRFIELAIERGTQTAFKGKYAAILTTSVRFFDHMAHAYLHGISEDFGMQVAGAYSAEMYDLVKEEEQKRIVQFWRNVVKAAEEKVAIQRRFDPLHTSPLRYSPGPSPNKVQTNGRNIVIVTDGQEGSNLQGMVAKVRECFADPVEVVNLNAIKMLGGCMGCIQCGLDNVCFYRDADDVFGVYQKLRAADIVIEAATITDRFLSARWKTFWDRGFFNNHVPILVGKQIGYLISGSLRQLPHLQEVLEASGQLHRANLVGIVTDECSDSRELDGLLERFVGDLIACDKANYIHPPTFLGKAGHKILRDEIWASLRFIFPRDHEYYKKHGLYDFPRRSLKTRFSESFMRLLLKFPRFRKEFKGRIRTEMVKPLEKVVEEA
jgi:multimeric flavodoxin WrbA